MKFVALVSGGKDSIYSILQCCRQGHELLGCVHLGVPVVNSDDDDKQDEESYMYQSAASEALVTLVEECLQVPLVHYRRVGKSLNTSLVYQDALEGDEVEDLYQALTMAQQKFPDVQAVSSGAILSTYQRVRIENVCARLNLTSLSYLWRAAPQHDLLDRMISDGITAVLVRAACPPGLKPHRHLNNTLQELQPTFLRLNQMYQFHVCGEGGEYESLVLDCPLYKKKLVLDEVQVLELEGDEGVGVLKIIQCHAEEKTESNDKAAVSHDNDYNTTSSRDASKKAFSETNSSTTQSIPIRIRYLPNVRHVGGGLWHVSEIMASIIPTGMDEATTTEATLAVQEARTVLQILDSLLKKYGCTAQDVLFVHLYLSEISHFAKINAYYRQFFGTVLPPSRSCVAIGRNVLPGGRRVSLDCLIQCGSGAYLRSKRGVSPYADAALDNTSSRFRDVLHVQSISHWAPICVGPYSQANTARSSLHFLAGQIGLKPATMSLHSHWQDQLRQCWTNVASVLDALEGGSLDHLISSVVYVADHIIFGLDGDGENHNTSALQQLESICRIQLERNGGVIAGKVDSPIASPNNSDDHHDEDTKLQGTTCSCLVVSIPQMPVGAVVEVEVIAATRQAASALSLRDTDHVLDAWDPAGSASRQIVATWDTGHDFPIAEPSNDITSKIHFGLHLRSLGHGCAGIATMVARPKKYGLDTTLPKPIDLNPEEVLNTMITGLESALSMGNASSSGVRLEDVLHVRLFYLAAEVDCGSGRTLPKDDGLLLRSSLKAALASNFSFSPAYSVVPVQAIYWLQNSSESLSHKEDAPILMALQICILNPVQIDADMWIQHGRE